MLTTVTTDAIIRGPVYRPPSRAIRGAWAKHIHAKRRELGLSQTQAFERWGAGLGLGERSRASYVAIDYGDRQPSEAQAAYLVSVIGTPPDDLEEQEVAAGFDPVAAAIDRQTAVLSELVGLLHPLVEGQASRLDQIEEVLRALVSPTMQGGGGRMLPRVSME